MYICIYNMYINSMILRHPEPPWLSFLIQEFHDFASSRAPLAVISYLGIPWKGSLLEMYSLKENYGFRNSINSVNSVNPPTVRTETTFQTLKPSPGTLAHASHQDWRSYGQAKLPQTTIYIYICICTRIPWFCILQSTLGCHFLFRNSMILRPPEPPWL